jgi:alanyl-tRNA synthetase
MSLDEATALWAKAFFEDKYGDVVRVIKISNHSNEMVSIELCWGTHVKNTKDVGCFAIIGQEAVASWIKRISAFVGPKVVAKVHEVQDILNLTIEKLWIKTYTQLVDKLDKTLKEYDEMKTTLEGLESKVILQSLQSSDVWSDKNFQKIIKIWSDLNFKNILSTTKWLFDDINVIILNDEWNFLILTKKWVSAKNLAQELWLKWWGNDSMVQWRDEKVLELFK